MTDHLPECEVHIGGYCICAQLRACEQRVRDEHQADLDHVSYVLGQTNERQRSVLLIADAYAAGVQAARDAVAALPKEDGGYCHVFHACDVEAAIDALRGES